MLVLELIVGRVGGQGRRTEISYYDHSEDKNVRFYLLHSAFYP